MNRTRVVILGVLCALTAVLAWKISRVEVRINDHRDMDKILEERRRLVERLKETSAKIDRDEAELLERIQKLEKQVE